MRHFALAILALVWSVAVHAEPGAHWAPADRSAKETASIDATVQDYVREQHPTALMVVQSDRLLATAGDITRKVNVHSVRKSLLGALYGIAAARGQISLDSTVAELGIDDTPPSLTAQEKQATVRQLLMARSGVYHPANYETPEMKLARPARGAHSPGTFWYYNNWDFNALGTIYAQATGKGIFQSFEELIARPLGMEDFTASDGVLVGDTSSEHRAYVFRMSARDLARFGLLILDNGRWSGAQIVPAQWIAESTRAYSETDRRDRGYGYLWWTLSDAAFGNGAALASGNGGQYIAVLPAKRLVVVQLVAIEQNIPRIRGADFLRLVRRVAALVPAQP